MTHYRKKHYDVCTNLLWYILLLARQPDQIQLDNRVDFSHHELIRQSAEINFIYNNLIQVPATHNGKRVKKPKAKKLTQKEESKVKFYQNPKNQDFLQTINDVNLLVMAKQSPPITEETETNSKLSTKKSTLVAKTGTGLRPQKSSRVDSDELIIPVMISGRKKMGKSKISLGE